MHYEINKETLDAIMAMPGDVKGTVLKEDENFILQGGGKSKLEGVEKEIKEMGHPFVYREIKSNDFYPWGRKIISLLAISRVFNMDRQKVKEMGSSAFKKTFWEKTFMKYVLPPKKIVEKEIKNWRKYHTIGRLEVVDVKEKTISIRLYNLNYHPIFCDYLAGRFQALIQAIKGEDGKCEEVKCYFKGEDPFHEFLLKW